MTVKDLERLYDYGYWANRKLFQVVSQLRQEQFTETVAGSYGSIRNTLVHVLSAEWGWLDRCDGPQRGPALKPDDFPTVESLVTAWSRVEGYVREFLSQLKDEYLVRTVEYTNPRGEKRLGLLGPPPATRGHARRYIIVGRSRCYFGRSAPPQATLTYCSTMPRRVVSWPGKNRNEPPNTRCTRRLPRRSRAAFGAGEH